jgi:hypothetical protein
VGAKPQSHRNARYPDNQSGARSHDPTASPRSRLSSERRAVSFAFNGLLFLVGSGSSPSFAARCRGREHPRCPDAALIEPSAQYCGVAPGGQGDGHTLSGGSSRAGADRVASLAPEAARPPTTALSRLTLKKQRRNSIAPELSPRRVPRWDIALAVSSARTTPFLAAGLIRLILLRVFLGLRLYSTRFLALCSFIFIGIWWLGLSGSKGRSG